ncbi:MAG: hypothetical protein KKF33_16215 [Alphaproteobacteria bacterium]|nr:hypothetical protein [Alphaproteobacteria bacterium]
MSKPVDEDDKSSPSDQPAAPDKPKASNEPSMPVAALTDEEAEELARALDGQLDA